MWFKQKPHNTGCGIPFMAKSELDMTQRSQYSEMDMNQRSQYSSVLSLEATLNKRIRELSDQNYKLSNAHSSLENKFADLHARYNKSTKRCERLERMNQTSDRANQQQSQHNARLEAQIAAQRKYIVQLESQNNQLNREVSSAAKTGAVTTMRTQSVLRNENDMLSTELEDSRAEATMLGSQVKALRFGLGKAASLRAGSDGAAGLFEQLGEQQAKVAALSEELTERTAQLTEVTQALEDAQQEAGGLRDVLDQVQSETDDLAQSRTMFERTETRLRDVEAEREAMAEILRERAVEAGDQDVLKEEVQSLQDQLDDMRRVNAGHEAGVGRLGDRVADLEAQLEAAEREAGQVRDRGATLESLAEGLRVQVGRQECYIGQLEEVQAELLTSLDDAQTSQTAMEERIRENDAQTAAGRRVTAAIEQEMSTLRTAHAEQVSTLHDARDSVTRRAEEDVRALQGAVADAEAATLREKTLRQTAEEEVVKLKQKFVQAEQTAEARIGEAADTQGKAARDLDAAKAELDAARSRTADVEAALARMERDLEHEKADVADLHVRVKVLLGDQENLGRTLAEERRSHDRHVASLIAEIAALRMPQHTASTGSLRVENAEPLYK